MKGEFFKMKDSFKSTKEMAGVRMEKFCAPSRHGGYHEGETDHLPVFAVSDGQSWALGYPPGNRKLRQNFQRRRQTVGKDMPECRELKIALEMVHAFTSS